MAFKFARYYYPGWRQYQNPGTRGVRQFQTFIVRSWDKGYHWTPANFNEPFKLFPGKYTSIHSSGDDGPYELSDGRWMVSVQGTLSGERHWVAGVTFSRDKGSIWSPAKVIHDYHPKGCATEQRILKLDERRYLSYTPPASLAAVGQPRFLNQVHPRGTLEQRRRLSRPYLSLSRLVAGKAKALGGTSATGTVMVWPQNLHDPDWPAYWSATEVCLPQCGQANEIGMTFRFRAVQATPVNTSDVLWTIQYTGFAFTGQTLRERLQGAHREQSVRQSEHGDGLLRSL